MPRAEEHCSTREAAKMLDVSLRTVQLWVEVGVLRAWKTAGGHRRVLKSSVDGILAERQRTIEEGFKTAVHADSPAEKLRVLVVEDDPDLLKLYELNLQNWDFPLEIITTTDGFEALLLIGERKPHFLISDLNMPGFDGFRMLRSIRNVRQFDDLQIVAVTALDRPEIEDRGGLPEGIRVLPKPIPFRELEKLVRVCYAGLQGNTSTGVPEEAAG